jgi:hypothetical protein
LNNTLAKLAAAASLLAAATCGAVTIPFPIVNGQLWTSLNGEATNSITNVLNVGTGGLTVFYGSGANLTGVNTGGGGNSNFFLAGTNIYIFSTNGGTGTTNTLSVAANVLTNNYGNAGAASPSGWVVLSNLYAVGGVGNNSGVIFSANGVSSAGYGYFSSLNVTNASVFQGSVTATTFTGNLKGNVTGGGVGNTFTNIQVYGSNVGVISFFTNLYQSQTNVANYAVVSNNITTGGLVLAGGNEVLSNLSGNACLYVPSGQKLKVGASAIGATDGYVQANGSLLTALNGTAIASGQVGPAYLGTYSSSIGTALCWSNSSAAYWSPMTNLTIGSGDKSLTISAGAIDTSAMLQLLSASNGFYLGSINVSNLIGTGAVLTNANTSGYATNLMVGNYSATNWVGTNDYWYYATNTVGPGTNWLVYTNAWPGTSNTYIVNFTVFGTCQTNPGPQWFTQGYSYVVTNGPATTGAANTNATLTRATGSGWSSGGVSISNSVPASAGYGITMTPALTNTESFVVKVEVITP